MANYIIGIDGGGTKTLGVLYDIKGKELKRVQLDGCNISYEREKAIDTIQKIVTNLKKKEGKYFVQIGFAGYGAIEDKEALLKRLKTELQADVNLVSDAEIALHSVKQNDIRPTILILGGTGSAIMYHINNQTKLIGGFGHLIGDEGSGYHLSMSALKHIINQFEESNEISNLTKAIMDKLNIKEYQDIKKVIYSSTKAEIATLSKYLSQFAEEGNLEAIELFTSEGKHIARQTLNAYRKMNTKEHVIIAFRGGFLQNAPLVKETVIHELKKNNMKFTEEIKEEEPILGTYYLGLRNLGVG